MQRKAGEAVFFRFSLWLVIWKINPHYGHKKLLELLEDKAGYLIEHKCVTIDNRAFIFLLQTILKKSG